MDILICLLVAILSSVCFRIRGGLRIKGKKFPLNKYWWALFGAIFSCCVTYWSIQNFLIGLIAFKVSTSCFGWGKEIGALLSGQLDKEREDCEPIEDILNATKITIKGQTYSMTDFPRLYGFLGLAGRGLILTFIIGLYLQSISFMITGLAMSICYSLGGLLEKYHQIGKNGWNWGEYIFGFYLGLMLAILL